MHLQQAEVRESLERELDSPEFSILLQHLQQANPTLAQFANWAAITSLLGSRHTELSVKDGVLRPILAEYAGTEDPRWLTVLTLVLWPLLAALHRRSRSWDRDPEELWQNLCVAFLLSVNSVDLAKRSDRLMPYLYYLTLNRLYRLYQREWERRLAEPRRPAQLDRSVSCPDQGLAEVEHRDARQAAEIRLMRHARAGVISEADADLLIATRVRGERLVDFCKRRQVPYERAKARRWRAEKALRRVGQPSEALPAA